MKRFSRLAFIGLLIISSFSFNACQGGKKVESNYNLVSVEGSVVKMDSTFNQDVDSDALAIIQPYKVQVNKVMNKVIGTSDLLMDKGKPESLLSNLVADVLRQSAQKVLKHPADIAVMNMGGLRNILPKGDITVGTVFQILPFENSLCVISLKGKDVKDLFKAIAAKGGDGLSGANLVISTKGKLISAKIADNEIDEDKVYTIATIDYLADGNDGMLPMLKAVKRDCPDYCTLRSLFLKYVKNQTKMGKSISSSIDHRIVVK